MVLRVILISFLFVTIGLAIEDKENKEVVHPVMKKFDKNGDGKLFYTEVSEDLQEHFCQYDVNQDGYLDSKEIKSVPKRFAKDK